MDGQAIDPMLQQFILEALQSDQQQAPTNGEMPAMGHPGSINTAQTAPAQQLGMGNELFQGMIAPVLKDLPGGDQLMGLQQAICPPFREQGMQMMGMAAAPDAGDVGASTPSGQSEQGDSHQYLMQIASQNDAGLAGLQQMFTGSEQIPTFSEQSTLGPVLAGLSQMLGGSSQQQSPSSLNVEGIRRDFPILRRKVNGHPLIWFDNGATTQKPQQVIDAISHFYSHYNSNIHRGAHQLAAEATDAYEDARNTARDFLGAAKSSEIVFLRGTTEAINLVAQSWGRSNIGSGDEIMVSELEHHANIVPWQMLAQEKGAVLKVIPVDDQGEIMLGHYQSLFSSRTKIVAIAHASNVLGTVPPLQQMIAIAHARGVPVLVDGAQSVAHTPVNVQQLDADFYVFSGHKIFGPSGVGILYGKEHLLDEMPPWQGGGSMIKDVTFERTVYSDLPAKFEAGTPTIGPAIGLGAALKYVMEIGMPRIEANEHALTQYAMRRMKEVSGIRILGHAPNKIGVLSFLIDGIEPAQIGQELNKKGIAIRVGHHCAQPILRRFGLEQSARASLALYNTEYEVDNFVNVLHQIANSARRR